MSKKKHHEQHHEEHADETWLIPYADLLTLLLALFIVLFASSNVDKQKFESIAQAFADAFSGPTDVSSTIGNFTEQARGLGDDNVDLAASSRGATITISDTALFEYGTTKVKIEAHPLLRKVVILLKDERYKRFKVIIEGHTDDQEFSSPLYASNWELSCAQAGSIVNELAKLGIPANRFKAVGMGGIAPAYPNYDSYGSPVPENRKRNRRIVIRIEP